MQGKNIITTREEYDKATEETVRLHEAIGEELKSECREAAEGHALAVALLTRERALYLEDVDDAEYETECHAQGQDAVVDIGEMMCTICGLPLDADAAGRQCYNQAHNICGDVFLPYVGGCVDVEPCGDEDCPECCGCARCESGEVRHCPECGANESEDDENVREGCPMCGGTGAVSRSRS